MCAYTHWRPLSILPPLPLLHDIADSETPPTPVGLTKSHTLHLHEVKRRSVRVTHYIPYYKSVASSAMCQPWATPCTYQPVVLSPDLPSTVQEERGSGEYCTTFLYLRRISAVQSDWLIWQVSQLYRASFPQTTYLYLITPSNLLKPSKTLQKA